MCELCDESEDGTVCCQDCGRIICFDINVSDDVTAPAYVTASGDLFCSRCGRRIDEEEEAAYENEYDDVEYDYDEMVMVDEEE